jgi:hypothetical protein
MFFVVLIVSMALWALVLFFEPFESLVQNFKSPSDVNKPRFRRRRNF